jgi:hypothetical protein
MSGKNFGADNYHTLQGTDWTMKESVLKDAKDSNFQVDQQQMAGNRSEESPKVSPLKLRGCVGLGDGGVSWPFGNRQRDGTVSNLKMSDLMESTL